MIHSHRRRAAIVGSLWLALTLILGACGASGSQPTKFYAAPQVAILKTADTWQRDGRTTDAAALREIASVPQGVWAAGQPGDIALVKQTTQAAARADAIPLIVAYDLPNRDSCGKLSAAYGPTAAGYEQWIDELAGAIGDSYDMVIVEPDGLADIVRGCLSAAQELERYQLLHYAMQKLGALPHASVFLDAGNPGMFANPGILAGPLVQAGVKLGRGFSANVSNFQFTNVVVTWSQGLEHDLGGNLGAIIDTSRNGDGPYTGPIAPQWCNPPGRALGEHPTLNPGPHGIVAYVWAKNPWASDGPCNGGGAAGDAYPDNAVRMYEAALALK